MRSWTKEELLADARDHGFDLTERSFTNWVQKGLLANATRQGRGPGSGVASFWPDTQQRLLLKLLDERSRSDRLAALAAVPIIIWVHSRDEIVDTTQVMKAMQTWVKGFGTISGRSAERPAREFVEQIAGPDVDPRLRNRFVKLIQEFSPYPESFDRDSFKSALEEVLKESTTDTQLNAEGATYMVEDRLRATQRIEDFTRTDFLAARTMVRATVADYRNQAGDLFEVERDDILRRAPLDLAIQLGVIGLRRD